MKSLVYRQYKQYKKKYVVVIQPFSGTVTKRRYQFLMTHAVIMSDLHVPDDSGDSECGWCAG